MIQKYSAVVFLMVLTALPFGRAWANESGAEVQLKASSLDGYRTNLRFDRWLELQPGRHKVKIAVLDKGFAGWEQQLGVSLPDYASPIEGPVARDEKAIETPHGRLMAEIVTSLLWGPQSWRYYQRGPDFELRLYRVDGFSNFKNAIDQVIADQVDVVLYSEVWELGGNWDGRGFINREVQRAVDAGVLWINASGNFSGRTWNGGIKVGAEDCLQLPDPNSALKFVCKPVEGQTSCPLRATLTWNDFKDDRNLGTTKDLELVLMDDLTNVLAVSAQEQVDVEGDAPPGKSKYPRESLSKDLKAGTYFVKVKARSKTWSANDKLRITLDGDFIDFPRGEDNETLLNPADLKGVVTVGAWDAERSSRSFKMNKPDLLAPSSVKDNSGREFRGSSNAAAIVAAGAVVLRSHYPQMTREGFLRSVGHELVKDQPRNTRFFRLTPPPR